MPPRGRKPKASGAKRRAGNPGKRPLPEDSPQPATARPECPAWLAECELSRFTWDWVCDQLEEMGVLTSADRIIVELITTEYVQYVRAEQAAREDGLCSRTAETRNDSGVVTGGGNLVQSPYLSIVNQGRKRLHGLLAEVGLTPTARTRLDADVARTSRLRDFARDKSK